MMYSSAVFKSRDCSLYEAQCNKLDLICQRLDLNKGDTVVEIGTGWGGFAIYAAKHYGVHVTTTTISDAQYSYAKQKIQEEGLSDKITLLKKDYRLLVGKFDKLVSIEMIEAVGHEYMPVFFEHCGRLLKDNGKMLIQAITIADQRYDSYRKQSDFIQRYIFPGGMLPCNQVMLSCLSKKTSMRLTALHDIGLDYAMTLQHWSSALKKSKNELPSVGLDEQFYRMWQFYFQYCQGGFEERLISTVHFIAEKPDYIDKNHAISESD